jgi:hypothetical protein
LGELIVTAGIPSLPIRLGSEIDAGVPSDAAGVADKATNLLHKGNKT